MPTFALILAAFLAFITCPVPPKQLFTIPRLAWTIAWYLPLPWVVAVALMALNGWRNVSWRLAATAWWFGPYIILSRVAPEWTPVAVALWTLQLFAALMSAPPPQHRALSLITALSIQGVVMLAALGYSGWAAGAIVIPVAILTWGFAPVQLRWARPAIALAILLLTLIPMSDYLLKPVASIAGGSPFAKGREEPEIGGKKAAAAGPREVHRGVILWPPKVEQIQIVTPVPAVTRRTLLSRKTPTLRIPFSGVYWFFQPPHLQIPKDSFTEYGVPTEKTYRSTGGLPMVMEAHQHLGTTVTLTCCRAIQVELTNADPFGAETLLELILWDTTQRAKPSMSLGLLPVESRPTLGMPTPATLTFPLPTSRRIQSFDAVAVRFHRSQFRRTRSARMRLESFVLVP